MAGYRLGGEETLHVGMSGPAMNPRPEWNMQTFRAIAIGKDGTETLAMLGASEKTVADGWESAFRGDDEEGLAERLAGLAEVLIQEWRESRGRGEWRFVALANLRSARFAASIRRRKKAKASEISATMKSRQCS